MPGPSFSARLVGVLLFAASTIPPLQGADGQQAAEPIQFQLAKRGAGVAKEPREVLSLDRKVLVRVVGERFKAAVRLFEASSGKPLGPTIDLRAHRVTALAVAPDNQTIATAVGNFSNDWGDVRVWRGATGEQVARYRMDREGREALGEVFQLSFREDGKTVLIATGPAGGR